MITDNKKPFNLNNLPPSGHKEAGTFFYKLFQEGYKEKQRLNLDERFMENHRVFRCAKDPLDNTPGRSKYKFPINLFFANVVRTVANITARSPIAEVVIVDGKEDDSDVTITSKLKTWWNETEQNVSLAKSAQNMEVNGITIEKYVYNRDKKRHDTVIVDPFAFVPAPGYYEELNDIPYLCHISSDTIDNIEFFYGVEGVQPDDVYSILGEQREDNRPMPSGYRVGSLPHPGNYTSYTGSRDDAGGGKYSQQRALVIELWIRDYSTKQMVKQIPVVDPSNGQPAIDIQGNPILNTEIQEIPIYPGGVRVVTITNHGNLVLNDTSNPNINLALARDIYSETYLYDRFPFYKVNSYEDTTSIWGFSALEQTGDLMNIIGEMLSRVAFYLARVATPILIIPKDTGITKQMITNKPGLIIQPSSTAASQGIRFLQIPNLPSNYFEILGIYTKFYDRISQIEDADRGAVPDRVVSGAAIQSLQERGAVLIRAKIRAVDTLVRERGRCALHFYQNFGVDYETLSVQDETRTIRGIDFAGRKYNYIVESGSTVAKTSISTQEQSIMLYEKGAIDRQALLETLNFPRWREIIERVGEGQLNQAMQILVQAGLPEDVAQTLTQQLMQKQGGPGSGRTGTVQSKKSSPTQVRGAVMGGQE